MAGHEYVVADVFTDVPLEGNPVAVFPDAGGLDDSVMQDAARELNLSESVFVIAGADAEAEATVRIFTPKVELPFAGHPVLGTAFVLAAEHAGDLIRVRCPAGVVPVALRRQDGRPVYGEMEQPIPTWEPLAQADAVLDALGVGEAALPVEVYDNGPRHAFVALGSDAAVGAVAPDLGALAAVGEFGVSCFHADGPRVHTRMFGPGLGVAEDPATGSAAGPLAVHLARHGVTGFGDWVEIRQGAEILRPSVLHACAEGSPEALARVAVGGAAVVVAEGRYRLGDR